MEKIYRPSPMIFLPDAIFALFTAGFSLIVTLFRYLRYRRTFITLGRTGITASKGIFSTTTIEIPYSKVNAVKLHQGIFGKVFNYGDLVIQSGNDISGEILHKFSSPQEIKNEIQKRVK